MTIPRFSHERIPVGDVHLGVARGGDGPPVAFRAALDHPAAVRHLAVLDVIPAVNLGESVDAEHDAARPRGRAAAGDAGGRALWQRPVGELPSTRRRCGARGRPACGRTCRTAATSGPRSGRRRSWWRCANCSPREARVTPPHRARKGSFEV